MSSPTVVDDLSQAITDLEPKPRVVWVGAIVAENTGEPVVTLSVGDQLIGQLTPDQARGVAIHLLEAADTAKLDAFTLGFFESRGMSRGHAGGFVAEFRRWREKEGAQRFQPTVTVAPDAAHPEDGSLPPTDGHSQPES